MEVYLLQHSDLSVLAIAARVCTGTLDSMSSYGDNLSERDMELIVRRILTSNGPKDPAHESIVEHVTYSFFISGFSRAMLQELARHRIASISVESTRYSIKKILSRIDVIGDRNNITEVISKYIVHTNDECVNNASINALIQLMKIFKSSGTVKNDQIKFCLPESFKTKCVFTINVRSLRNLFRLRTSKNAMWEFRKCAFKMYDLIPENHKFLFEDMIHER